MAFYKKFSPVKKSRVSYERSQGDRPPNRGENPTREAGPGGQERSAYTPKPHSARPAYGDSRRREGDTWHSKQEDRVSDAKPSFGRPAYAKPAAPQPSGKRFGPPSGSRFGKPAYGKPAAPQMTDRRFGAPGSGRFSGPARAPKKYIVPAAPVALPIEMPVSEQPAFDFPAVPENLLSGRNPIREAIKANRDIEKLLVASGELSGSAREILAMAKNAGIIVQTVDRSRLDQITRNHQGMIAYASAYPYASLEEILDVAKQKGEAPFVIIMDKITDPQNLGAVIRTAACVGAHGVIVQLHRAVGLTPSAVRASAGAIEHVKVARVININNTIKELKKQGIWVYAADAKGTDYRKVRFEGPCALVIGNEGEGVSALTLEICDQTVSIPMSGAMDSLNASVAAGILMYAVYIGRIS